MSLRRARSGSECSDSDRPSRRQRIEEAREAELPVLIRDSIFFKDSGDCYLRVENHLFKIHRYHLSRGDASVFKDMFLLPSGAHPSQGCTEMDPIALADDSVQRFRAFLTIAYAEPLELQVAETQPDQLPMLVDCAHFTHKYNITPLLLAALKSILHAVDAQPAIDSKIYISLLELSKLCDAIKIGDDTYQYKIRFAVEWGWVSHLSGRDFPALTEALNAAETYGLGFLSCFASSYYLDKMVGDAPELTAPGVVPPFHTHPWLKTSHRLRILSGAWSRERAWTHFADTVPAFPIDHRCSKKNHTTYCVQLWEREWRRAVSSSTVLTVPSVNLTLRRLNLEDELKPVFAKSACISAAFKVEELLEHLNTGSSHFENVVLVPR
ncbi:hypothetical protein B0H19DRAFT_152200 [Mycena capillaripes]|nr:hypothetical protein B0H19DRAFT_152200 [Mycena capillaripes]